MFLLIGHLIIQYSFFPTIYLSGKPDVYSIAGDLITHTIIVFFIVLAVVPFLAFIPFKGMGYNEKFIRIVPIIASTVLIVLIANFGYLAYKKKSNGLELRPLHKYDDIEIPIDIHCEMVHNGKFETDKSIIIRDDKKQIQINKKTGKRNEFIIEWVSDCEYILTSVEDNSEKLRVKITAINPDNYGCYVISDKYADRYPNFMIIKRIK